MHTRRTFIKQTLLGAGGLMLAPSATYAKASSSAEASEDKSADRPNTKAMAAPRFEISLAEWSFHRALQAGKLDHLDFPAKAKNDFNISVVEYVNGFFGGKKMNFKEAGKSSTYLAELLKRSKDAGVINHLIMVDEEGPLALPNDQERLPAIENHKKWIDAAKFLGCKTVRVNLHGDGSPDSKKTASIDSLGKL